MSKPSFLGDVSVKAKDPTPHRHHNGPPLPPPPPHRPHNGPPMPPPPPHRHHSGPPMPPSPNHRPQHPAMPPIPQEIKRRTDLPKSKPIEHLKRGEQVQIVSEETARAGSIFKMLIFAFLLYAVAVGLEFLRFNLPFLPTFLAVDFSIFPEFVSTVFFGPIVGVVTIILKNATHMLIYYFIYNDISYVGELSNLIDDTVFVLLAFAIFYIIAGKKVATRSLRIGGILLSGACSAFATALIMLPVYNSLLIPMYVKYFEKREIALDVFAMYAEKLPSLENMWQGLLVFNLPWNFGKLLAVTIISAIIYTIATAAE